METTGLSLNSPSYLHYDVLVDWDKVGSPLRSHTHPRTQQKQHPRKCR